MITLEDIVNTFPEHGEYTHSYDKLRKFKTASVVLKLRTELNLIDEMELRFEIDLTHIFNNKNWSILNIKPLLDDGWCYDRDRASLYLPLSS